MGVNNILARNVRSRQTIGQTKFAGGLKPNVIRLLSRQFPSVENQSVVSPEQGGGGDLWQVK